VKGRVVSHASMSLKKKKLGPGGHHWRAEQETNIRVKDSRLGTNGVQDLGNSRVEGAIEEEKLGNPAIETVAGKGVLLCGGGGKEVENRSAAPALPTPIATFTI
jgi:hypothetical protein